jgi:hypothetical protein
MLALLLSTSTLISHESSYNRLAYICILTQPEKEKRGHDIHLLNDMQTEASRAERKNYFQKALH